MRRLGIILIGLMALLVDRSFAAPPKHPPAQSGQLALVLPHDHEISGARWSPDGSKILTWTVSDMVYVWDANTGAMTGSFVCKCSFARPVWSPDSQHILGDNLDQLIIWDVNSGEIRLEIPTNSFIEGITWTPIDNQIAVVYSPTDNNPAQFQVWDVVTQQPISTIPLLDEVALVDEFIWSTNGELVVVVGVLLTDFFVIDLLKGQVAYSHFAHNGLIVKTYPQLSQDGQRMLHTGRAGGKADVIQLSH